VNRAVFLDRDGVINQKAACGQYITRWEELRILPGVVEAIRLIKEAGYLVIVATNQRAVAKGLLTPSELEDIHQRLTNQLRRDGAVIDDIYYCPHELEPACCCRKPKAGMLLDAARKHEIDLSHSWMIGDSDRDVEAGKTAGCRTIRLVQPHEHAGTHADALAESLLAAAQQVLLLMPAATEVNAS